MGKYVPSYWSSSRAVIGGSTVIVEMVSLAMACISGLDRLRHMLLAELHVLTHDKSR
jgi:hypothetical protein